MDENKVPQNAAQAPETLGALMDKLSEYVAANTQSQSTQNVAIEELAQGLILAARSQEMMVEQMARLDRLMLALETKVGQIENLVNEILTWRGEAIAKSLMVRERILFLEEMLGKNDTAR